jgi:hypothetical protein
VCLLRGTDWMLYNSDLFSSQWHFVHHTSHTDEFEVEAVHVGFVVHEVTLGQVSPPHEDALDVLFCWLQKIPHRLHFYIAILKVPPHGWRVGTRPQCDRILDRSKDWWYSRDLRILKLLVPAFCSFWQPGSLHCESGIRLYSGLMEALPIIIQFNSIQFNNFFINLPSQQPRGP